MGEVSIDLMRCGIWIGVTYKNMIDGLVRVERVEGS